MAIGPLKTCSGLESVPRCDLSTYQPIRQCVSHCAIGVCGSDNLLDCYYLGCCKDKRVVTASNGLGHLLLPDAI